MQITFDFTEGQEPELAKGSMGYYFVRARSRHDGKVRMFSAYFLNAYPLHFEGGCNECEHIGEANCPMDDGMGCPVTGWFDEVTHPDFDSIYEPLASDVIAYCKPPKPADT